MRKCWRIPLKAVDWKDENFRSSLQRDIEPLRGSIRAVGVISPLRVQPWGNGFRIISGFLRCQACVSEGMTEVDAEIRNEEGSDEMFLLEALHENRFTRGFTWAERAWVLNRVTKEWGKPRSWALEWLMPALDLPSTPRVLEHHLRVATLSESILRALTRHGCSLANGLRLTHWPAGDHGAVITLLERLHLGENLLRECLETIREISLREGVSPAVILERPECREILEDPQRDRPRRTQDFRAYLRRKRYPMLVSMEDAFHKARAQLGLVQKQSIQASPFFEEEGVKVSFRARSPLEFKDLARNLWKASRKEEALDSLFRATEQVPE